MPFDDLSRVLPILAVGVLLMWRIYRRVRRMVGRQRLSRVRPWLSVTLFPLLVLLLALAALAHPQNLWVLAAAVTVGVGLGVYSLRHTRFESGADGLFYTPHAPIGIALSMLLVARVLLRFGRLAMLGTLPGVAPNAMAAAPPPDPLGQGLAGSMLTLAVVGLLAGYYVCYSAGLLRWQHSLQRAPD